MAVVPSLKAEDPPGVPYGCVGVPCKPFSFDLQEFAQLQANESMFHSEIFQVSVWSRLLAADEQSWSEVYALVMDIKVMLELGVQGFLWTVPASTGLALT